VRRSISHKKAGRRPGVGLLLLLVGAAFLFGLWQTLKFHRQSNRARATTHATQDPLRRGSHRRRPNIPTAISYPQPLQLKNFSAFRTRPEGVPKAIRAAFRVPLHQINWTLAQRLRTPFHIRFWIAPANHFLCLVAKTPGASPASFCAPTNYVLGHGLPATFLRAHGRPWPTKGSRLIVGIAPDKARRVLIQTRNAATLVPVAPDGVFILQDSLNAPPDGTRLDFDAQ
jgi:hypothetical protein